MNIEIGDKVVCVNDRWDAVTLKLYAQLPKRDVVYVVRDMRMGIRTDCRTGDLSLLLCGVVNPKAGVKPHLEFGFSVDRFRKLDELKELARETRKETKRKTRKELVPA